MRITYYTYNFPLRETFQYWDITFHKKTGSEGLIKIVADIKPSYCELLKFLKERNLISSNDMATNIWDKYIMQSSDEKYVKALTSFCNTQLNFQLSAWGYSFGDALCGGDTSCTDKAIKKIKKRLSADYTAVTKAFVKYLTDKGLL